jgi:hypothetical protein
MPSYVFELDARDFGVKLAIVRVAEHINER